MAPVFGTLAALGSTLAATVGSTAAAAGTALGGASGVASAVGTGLSAVGSIYSGIQQNAAAKAEAKQLKTKGDLEYAAAQEKARETRREKDLVMSRQRAVAAASGGGVSNETVEGLMARTEERGERSALLDLYNGAIMRNDLYNDAAATKASGKSALTGSIINAGATIGSGVGDIYDSARRRRRSATLY